jgi:hypothetical protein
VVVVLITCNVIYVGMKANYNFAGEIVDIDPLVVIMSRYRETRMMYRQNP